MRSPRFMVGLVVASLAMLWWLMPAEVAPPQKLAPSHAPAADNTSLPEPAAVQRNAAVATGAMAVTRLGDGSCELKVEVTDAHGKAVDGAVVTWQSEWAAAPFATLAADSRGLCSVRVSPGYLFVRASHRSIGTSILLRLSTDDQRPRVPRLALLKPAAITGVVVDAAGKPIANAQLIVQALLGIPRGHAAECVTSEFLQCDEAGEFVFEASYGTRGTLLMVSDEQDATHQCSFAAGRDGYVTVDPKGGIRAKQRVVPKPLGKQLGTGTWKPSNGKSKPSSESSRRLSAGSSPEELSASVRERSRRVKEAAARRAREHAEVVLADGTVPKRMQVCTRVFGKGSSKLKWQRIVPRSSQLPAASTPTKWTFVIDPDSGQSAQVTEADFGGRLNLGASGTLHVHATYNGGAARGVHVMIEPCGPSQTARLRSDGMARFRVPPGQVKVRVLRGVEQLATQIVDVRSGQRAEAMVSVDLSK